MKLRLTTSTVSTSKSVRFALLASITAMAGCASGTPWTIRCLELRGPDSRQHIEQIADTLTQTSGIRAGDVFARHGRDGISRLYYGTYHRRTDPRTKKRTMPRKMREDLDLLKQLTADSGQRFFMRAIPARMPSPDVGNPTWDLRNVDAVYSLQVAAFEPTDEFADYKRAAAKYCESLRERGYEAYYHHSEASSVVTVGAFGPEAVVLKPDGRTYYSEEVRALQAEELLKYNFVNYAIHHVLNDDGERVPVPSRLVEIPQDREIMPR